LSSTRCRRIQAERFGGRMSSSELLQAAADDLRFSWLKELSSSARAPGRPGRRIAHRDVTAAFEV